MALIASPSTWRTRASDVSDSIKRSPKAICKEGSALPAEFGKLPVSSLGAGGQKLKRKGRPPGIAADPVRFKTLWDECQLSQKQLAGEFQMSLDTIQRFERGGNPGGRDLHRRGGALLQVTFSYGALR